MMQLISDKEFEWRMALRKSLTDQEREVLDRGLLAECTKKADVKIDSWLVRGAHPDARDKDGNTGLHIAASHGAVGPAIALLEGQANPRLRNNSGKFALEIAVDNGSELLVKRIRQITGPLTGNLRAAAFSALTRFSRNSDPVISRDSLKKVNGMHRALDLRPRA